MKVLNGKSTFELWTGKLPDLTNLRTFGCLVYAKIEGKLTKLTERGTPCVNLGYDLKGDGYKLWKWDTCKVIISRNVQFMEGKSGFATPHANYYLKQVPEKYLWAKFVPDEDDADVDDDDDCSSLSSADDSEILLPHGVHPDPDVEDADDQEYLPHSPQIVEGEESEDEDQPLVDRHAAEKGKEPARERVHVEEPIEKGPPTPKHHSSSSSSSSKNEKHTRMTKKEKELKDLGQVYANQENPNSNVHKKGIIPRVTRSQAKDNAFNVTDFDTDNHIIEDDSAVVEHCLIARFTGFTKDVPPDVEPYIQAMKDEIAALENLEVFEEVDVPRGTKIIGVKWVLKEKAATSLTPAKLKARLVAKGFSQIKVINHEETHAPVARTASVRAVFAACAAKGWKVRQIDVDNAYLHGEMDMERVYIRQPPYMVDPHHPNRVWRLKKGLYGTKQGGHIWYETFTKFLIEEIGLIPHHADKCLFTMVDEQGKVVLIASLYVDDASTLR